MKFFRRSMRCVPLQASRVAFVTTGGAHMAHEAPFDIRTAAGDPSFRAFPSSTPLADIALSHRGYDTRRASADKNVVLPLDHLRAAVREGRAATSSVSTPNRGSSFQDRD